jgi:hypothetical protein
LPVEGFALALKAVARLQTGTRCSIRFSAGWKKHKKKQSKRYLRRGPMTIKPAQLLRQLKARGFRYGEWKPSESVCFGVSWTFPADWPEDRVEAVYRQLEGTVLPMTAPEDDPPDLIIEDDAAAV